MFWKCSVLFLSFLFVQKIGTGNGLQKVVNKRYRSSIAMREDVNRVSTNEYQRQRPRSLQEYNSERWRSIVKKGSIGCAILVAEAFLSSSSRAAVADEMILPECSDSIFVLEGPKGKTNQEIVLIGTAHISESSAELVRRTIRKLKPSVVMIELDVNRLGKVSSMKELSEAGFDVPTITHLQSSSQSSLPSTAAINAAPTFVQPAQDLFTTSTNKDKVGLVQGFAATVRRWVTRGAGAILGSSLRQFYNSVEKLGFKAGGEFSAAVEEGKAVGARILLGDRDVNLTLERLAMAIGQTDSDRYPVK